MEYHLSSNILTGQVDLVNETPVFRGNYSEVYRGRIGALEVAVKVIRGVASTATMLRKLHRERIVWAKLRHPCILPLLGFSDDDQFGPFGALISPWCLAGDAARYLADRGGSLDFYGRMDLWMEILYGIEFMHCKGVVHGDIKLTNILIDDVGGPKVCDFGLTRILSEGEGSGLTTTSEHTGTDRYLAPELLCEEPAPPTTGSDIWALGCVGLEIIYSQQPHAQRRNNMRGMIIQDIKAGTPPALEPPNTQGIDELIWRLLRHCWDANVTTRIAISRLLSTSRHFQGKPTTPNVYVGTHTIHPVSSYCRMRRSLSGVPFEQGSSFHFTVKHQPGMVLMANEDYLPALGNVIGILDTRGYSEDIWMGTDVSTGEAGLVDANNCMLWTLRQQEQEARNTGQWVLPA